MDGFNIILNHHMATFDQLDYRNFSDQTIAAVEVAKANYIQIPIIPNLPLPVIPQLPGSISQPTDASQSTTTELLICKYCGKAFQRGKMFEKHCKIHDQNFRVEDDKKPLTKSHKYPVYKNKSNIPENQYFCVFCGIMYDSLKELKDHECILAPFNDYMCKMCGFKTKYSWQLIKHIKQHESFPFDCSLCNFSTENRQVFKQHLGMHYHGRHFICQLCQKGFENEQLLALHAGTHVSEQPKQAQELPFLCRLCEKKFPSEQLLHQHVENDHQL